jgi:hypothetical protein
MERRQRRSRDQYTALHLFLEAQLPKLAATSIRVTRSGEIIAAVGDDVYTDEWTATWTVFAGDWVVDAKGSNNEPAASRRADLLSDVVSGVRRLTG